MRKYILSLSLIFLIGCSPNESVNFGGGGFHRITNPTNLIESLTRHFAENEFDVKSETAGNQYSLTFSKKTVHGTLNIEFRGTDVDSSYGFCSRNIKFNLEIESDDAHAREITEAINKQVNAIFESNSKNPPSND